ncbi:MAG: PqiC family protein [Burkholderiales bacterium]
MIRHYMLIAALLVATVLASCGSSPRERFYTLSTGAALEQMDVNAAYSVAVGPVTVPEIINRPQLVTYLTANQVKIAEQARWAEPLKSEIPRVIAGNLTQLLNGAYVSIYPQNASPEADYRVRIDVLRFDSVLGDAVTIEVLWTVRPAKSGAPTNGRSVVREATGGDGYDALVAAHGRALAAVSRDIAEAIRALSALSQ